MVRALTAEETAQVTAQIEGRDSAFVSFGHLTSSPKTRFDWHAHVHHQLVYSVFATAQIEVGNMRYFLQPGTAAWVSAGIRHRTTTGTTLASVFFHRKLVTWKTPPVTTFAAPLLLREMILESARWRSRRRAQDQLRILFFRTLALLCKEWMREGATLWLPNSADPQLAKAIEYAQENLESVTIKTASRVAAMSERSFRRHFSEALSMSWRSYLHRARLLRAMEMLTLPDCQVIAVAGQVGFDSPSAFSKAFRNLTGETPKRYRSRIVGNLPGSIEATQDKSKGKRNRRVSSVGKVYAE